MTGGAENHSRTDRRGRYSVGVYAYHRPYLDARIEASIEVRARGYASASKLLVPRPGRTRVNFRLRRAQARASYRVTGHFKTGLGTHTAASSADGEFFATAPFHISGSREEIERGSYLHYFSASGQLLFKYQLRGELWSVAVSADGQYVAAPRPPPGETAGWGDSVMLFDRSGALIWEQSVRGARTVEFSPDGTRIAVGTENGLLYTLDRATGATLWQRELGSGNVRLIRWEADRLYVAWSNGSLRALTPAGEPIWVARVHGVPLSWAVSRNFILAAGKIGRETLLFRKSDGSKVWSWPATTAQDELLISPDESRFVRLCNADDSTKTVIFDRAGRPLWSAGNGAAGTMTSDGKYLLTVDFGTELNLYDRDGSVVWTRSLSRQEGEAPRGYAWISPDKRRIAVATSAGDVYFFSGTLTER